MLSTWIKVVNGGWVNVNKFPLPDVRVKANRTAESWTPSHKLWSIFDRFGGESDFE